MIKRVIKEITKEYDDDGRVTRETVTETTEEDNNAYSPYQTHPILTTTPIPWWSVEPYYPTTTTTYEGECRCRG